jgi:hypothetical protein
MAPQIRRLGGIQMTLAQTMREAAAKSRKLVEAARAALRAEGRRK